MRPNEKKNFNLNDDIANEYSIIKSNDSFFNLEKYYGLFFNNIFKKI